MLAIGSDRCAKRAITVDCLNISTKQSQITWRSADKRKRYSKSALFMFSLVLNSCEGASEMW